MSSELFITEIDSTRKLLEPQVDRLEHVRNEHKKVKEIVENFRSKVDKLVDRQRQEYVQAYETHVQDVQKELHHLREKVYEIANDETKNERTEKLKEDLKNYKNEAIQLEEDSDELRSTMARLVRTINGAGNNMFYVFSSRLLIYLFFVLFFSEKSRDWLLKKLRVEKKRYNTLLREKIRLYEENSLMTNSLDQGSSFTLEFQDHNPQKTSDKINSKFQRGVRSHATVQRAIHLPKINKNSNNNSMRNTPHSASSPALARLMTNPSDLSFLLEDELSKLLSLRACMQDIRDYLELSKNSVGKRPWNRVEKRKLNTLLEIGENICAAEEFPPNKQLLPIVCELAATPEVYEIILEMIGPCHDL
jgi:uncharacterized protein YukE